MITACLNMIFEKEHTLSLDRLKTLSKRDARQFLKDMPDMHPFVEAYTMLFGFDGHAVPVDDTILTYLKSHNIVEAAATIEEAQKFLEHAVKSEEHYELYAALRRASIAEAGKKKK
jgi:hypothetical protein